MIYVRRKKARKRDKKSKYAEKTGYTVLKHRQGREWVVNKRNLKGTSCQEKLRKNACHYNFFLNEAFFLLSIISYYGTGMI